MLDIRNLFNSYAKVLKHLQIKNFHPALIAILPLKFFSVDIFVTVFYSHFPHLSCLLKNLVQLATAYAHGSHEQEERLTPQSRSNTSIWHVWINK